MGPRKICSTMCYMERKNIDLTVAVNLSVYNLHDTKLLRHIDDLLAHNDLPAEKLVIEVNESDIMAEPLRAKEILTNIKKPGVYLSIDDFGTGYSSLSYIK